MKKERDTDSIQKEKRREGNKEERERKEVRKEKKTNIL